MTSLVVTPFAGSHYRCPSPVCPAEKVDGVPKKDGGKTGDGGISVYSNGTVSLGVRGNKHLPRM